MKNTQTFATNKIIILVAFICCALMASLFVYHASHKQTLTVLADGNATIFPVARDIKPFEFYSSSNRKFTQQDLMNHWTVIFFGFTHCASVCPVTLDMLSQTYKNLSASHPNLQVVLISLDPARDTPDAVSEYARRFNPNFIGVTGKIQAIRKLQSQFGIFSARDDATPGENYQIQHSSSILLINPQGKWAGMFKSGITPAQFISAFDECAKLYA
jgi:protein SCO1/2